MLNNSARSVIREQITTKIFEVSPKKPSRRNLKVSEGNDHPMVFRILPKLTRRRPKITDELRGSPEDFRRFSKVTNF